MKAFENYEIAFVEVPTTSQVLDGVRRDEPCRADPLRGHCNFEWGMDEYLLRDVASHVVCQHCPVFSRKLQQMMADWEEWVLAMQDVYT